MSSGISHDQWSAFGQKVVAMALSLRPRAFRPVLGTGAALELRVLMSERAGDSEVLRWTTPQARRPRVTPAGRTA